MKKIKEKKEAMSNGTRLASRSQNFIPLDERNAYHRFRFDNSRPLHLERLSFLEAPNGFHPKGPNEIYFKGYL